MHTGSTFNININQRNNSVKHCLFSQHFNMPYFPLSSMTVFIVPLEFVTIFFVLIQLIIYIYIYIYIYCCFCSTNINIISINSSSNNLRWLSALIVVNRVVGRLLITLAPIILSYACRNSHRFTCLSFASLVLRATNCCPQTARIVDICPLCFHIRVI